MGKPTDRALARQEMRRMRDGVTRLASHLLNLQRYLGGKVDSEVDAALIVQEEVLKALDDVLSNLYERI